MMKIPDSNEMASFEKTMAGNDLSCCVTPRVTDGTKDACNTIPSNGTSMPGGFLPPTWMAFESKTSKRERGYGWPTFRRKVSEERGNKCEKCGVTALSDQERSKLSRIERQHTELHLHHKLKQYFHRHLKFERSNVVLCCQDCHVILEKEADLDSRNINPVLAPIDPPNASEQSTQQAGAQRPKSRPSGRLIYGDEILPFLPSTSPNSKPEKKKSINRVNTIAKTQEDATPHLKPTKSVYTPPSAINMNLKLREQANRLGLIPGSPRWRAYVLGTISAMKKRKREKSKNTLGTV